MASWADMRLDEPALAAAGEALLYQHGVGLAYLATVSAVGSPRLHPMCPLLNGRGVFAFIIPSPKQRDLHRDGRFAMHSFPRPDDEDALFLSGQARLVSNHRARSALSDQFVAERRQFSVPPPSAEDHLFEFDIERALLTITTGHGDPHPVKQVWRPPANTG